MSNPRRVSIALILGPENNVLMGMREDNSTWTFPAGSADPGEDPYSCLIREVFEETGLEVTDAKLVRAGVENGINLFLFLVKAKGNVDASKDPDQECKTWTWEDPFDRAHELHVPFHRNWAIQWWSENC